MHYKSYQHVIKTANKLGSASQTFKGASRFLIGAVAYSVPLHKRGGTARFNGKRKDYETNRRNYRLLRRYLISGEKYLKSRLNKGFISQHDFEFILNHKDRKTFFRLMTLPNYVAGFYAKKELSSEVWDFPKVKKQLRNWEREKGILKNNSRAEDYAYVTADWGRLRKRYTGKCVLYPKIETETNGKGRWDKVSWHYANYTYIEPRKPKTSIYTAYYQGPNKDRLTVYRSKNFIRLGGLTRVIVDNSDKSVKFPIHIQRRLLIPHVPKTVTLGFDREERLFTITDGFGEVYHLLRRNVSSAKEAKYQIQEAIKGLKRRRAQLIDLSKVDVNKVFVDFEDSIGSGNCDTITRSFAKKVWDKLDALGPCAVLASEVLGLRNDHYTQRAVCFAAANH